MANRATPFRWNMSSPGLGRRLGRGPTAWAPTGFKDDLLRCAARVVRAAGDVDLVFVGRSPESLFDLLAGALTETSWRERLTLLPLSLRGDTPGRLRREHPAGLAQLWSCFDALGLTPERLLVRPRPVALVDLVFNGWTFGNLLKLLRCWTETGGARGRWREVHGRLRFVCLVERGHRRYDPWARDESPWALDLPEESVRRVPIDTRLWRYLAEDQHKTTASYRPARWGAPEAHRPPDDPDRLAAARLARALYRYGRWRRRALAAELERPPRPERWTEALVRELRAG